MITSLFITPGNAEVNTLRNCIIIYRKRIVEKRGDRAVRDSNEKTARNQTHT